MGVEYQTGAKQINLFLVWAAKEVGYIPPLLMPEDASVCLFTLYETRVKQMSVVLKSTLP